MTAAILTTMFLTILVVIGAFVFIGYFASDLEQDQEHNRHRREMQKMVEDYKAMVDELYDYGEQVAKRPHEPS